MIYINPYELLNVNVERLSDVNEELIKKLKRRLLAEVHLNDEKLLFRNRELNKAECVSIIEELQDENKNRFHFYVYNNKPLNDLLTEGKLTFFEKYRLASIYNLPEFISFLSPRLAPRLEKVTLDAFKDNNVQLLQTAVKYLHLIKQSDLNIVFKGIDNELRNRINEVENLKNKIRQGYDESYFAKALEIIKTKFPIDLLNSLPDYFQSLINKAAEEINFMQLEMGEEYETKLKILSHIKQLNVNSVSKQTFDDNYEIVKTRLDENLELKAITPIIEKWAVVYKKIKDIIDDIEKKMMKSKVAISKATGIINIQELNELPPFGDEIRIEIASVLRSLSISFWNSQKDIETSLYFIELALKVNLSDKDRMVLMKDYQDLKEIKKRRETEGEPISEAPSLSTTNGIGTTIYNDTLYFVFFNIPIIPIARYNCTETVTGYKFYGQLKLHKWQKYWQWGLPIGIVLWIIIAMVTNNSSSSNYSSYTTSTKDYSTTSTPTNTTNNIKSPLNTEPTYKIIDVLNGNISGCSNIVPKYDLKINNKLIITADLTDAAVKLIDYHTNKCIRYVFINQGTTTTIKNIPQSTYYLKIAYGRSWGVKDGDPICKGHFTKKAFYKKADDLYNFNKKYYPDGRVSIPYYTLRLYTTFNYQNSTDNSSQNSISEDDFLND